MSVPSLISFKDSIAKISYFSRPEKELLRSKYSELSKNHIILSNLNKDLSDIQQRKTWLGFFACLFQSKKGFLGRIDAILCTYFTWYTSARKERNSLDQNFSSVQALFIQATKNYNILEDAYKQDIRILVNRGNYIWKTQRTTSVPGLINIVNGKIVIEAD